MNVPVEMPEGVEYEGVFGNTDFMVQKRILPYAAGPSAPAARRSAGAGRSMQYLASDEEYAEIERGISFGSFAAMACEEIEEIAPSKARRTSPVEVVSATGLDEVAIIDSLNEHLATLNVPRGTNGELVLEIVFGKVRASRIVVDADASTWANVKFLKTIKKWLFSWRIPHFIGDTTVRLTLRVRS